MTTPVTGAFGCIGAWVIRAGERPVVIDLGDDPWRVRTIAGDIADRMSLERVVRDHGSRRVIHLSAWQVPLCRRGSAPGRLDQRHRHRSGRLDLRELT